MLRLRPGSDPSATEWYLANDDEMDRAATPMAMTQTTPPIQTLTNVREASTAPQQKIAPPTSYYYDDKRRW